MSNFKIFLAVETEPLLWGIRGISNILNTMVYMVAVCLGALIVSKTINGILGCCCLCCSFFVYKKMKAISKQREYNQQKKKVIKPRIIQVRNSNAFRY